MKLSEAIRLGAMLHPQVFKAFCIPFVGTCALGAAADAVGLEVKHSMQPIYDTWPIAKHEGECPICEDCGTEIRLGIIIAHLNDDHQWTREAIADWVASVEQATSTNAVDPVAQTGQEVVRA